MDILGTIAMVLVVLILTTVAGCLLAVVRSYIKVKIARRRFKKALADGTLTSVLSQAEEALISLAKAMGEEHDAAE